MDNKLLEDLEHKEVVKKVKYSALFLGGVAVGYGIKKALDSEELKSFKNNASEMLESMLMPQDIVVNIERDDDMENDGDIKGDANMEGDNAGMEKDVEDKTAEE